MPPRSPSVRKAVAGRPRLVLQPDPTVAATRAFDNARARMRRPESAPVQNHPLLPQAAPSQGDKLDQILDGIRELLQRQAADERRLTKIEQRLEALDPVEEPTVDVSAPATEAAAALPSEPEAEAEPSGPDPSEPTTAPEPEPPAAA